MVKLLKDGQSQILVFIFEDDLWKDNKEIGNNVCLWEREQNRGKIYFFLILYPFVPFEFLTV